MADNVTVDNGDLSDYTVATDDIGGAQLQRVKIEHGADGTSNPTTAATPLPVAQQGAVTVNGTVTANVPSGLDVDATIVGTPTVVISGTVPVSGVVTANVPAGLDVDVLTMPPVVINDTSPVDVAVTNSPAVTFFGQNAEGSPPFGATRVTVGGIRRDAETVFAGVDDGDVVALAVDAVGRLKTSTQPALQPATTGAIISATSVVEAAIGRTSSVVVAMTGTFAGVNVTFEASAEAAGSTNWFTVQAVRSNANTIETTSGVLGAQPAYMWKVSTAGYARVRVRATAWTSGTATVVIAPTPSVTEPIPAVQVSGTQPVSGTVTATGVAGTAAHDAVISGNPVRVGGRAMTANYAAVASGDVADALCTTVGAQVVAPFSIPEASWQSSFTASAAGDTAVQAAIASNRRHCTGIAVQNTGAGALTFALRDGTTVIWQANLPAAMALPLVATFPNPLRTGQNAALNANLSVAGTVLVSAQGFTAP